MDRLAAFILTILLSLGMWPQAHAGSLHIKTLGANEYKKIRIILGSGRVVLNSAPETKEVQVVISKEELNPFWTFVDQGDTLEIRYTPTGTASASAEIALSGIPVPVEVFLREGQMTARRWDQGSLVMQKGTFQALETMGNWKVHVLEGEVDVGGHQGDLNLESYDAKVAIRSMKGDITGKLNSGTLSVESHQGNMNWDIFRAKTVVKGGQGDLRFESKQGAINIAGFQGSIVGSSESGPVTLRAYEAVDVRLTSNEAPIDVWVPAKSAAGVSLESQSGRIQVPKYLKISPWSTGSLVRGVLKGDVPGKLSLRTQSGRVSLKVD